MVAVSVTPAMAVTLLHSQSIKVALIPQRGPLPPYGPDAIMPVASIVTGRPAESFDQFSFTNVPLDQVTPAVLAQYDTAVLIQVQTSSLSATAEAALADFVAQGGKLIIHDADKTNSNDYSWLLPGSNTTRVGQGCSGCGSQSGSSTILTNSTLISANPADRSYVNLKDVFHFTDPGDSNLLTSNDPRWTTLTEGTNSHNESGAQIAFAGNNNGLIIYNGFDQDFIKSNSSDAFRCNDQATKYVCPPGDQPTVDWLAHMWYSELLQGWGTAPGAHVTGGSGGTAGLPKPISVADIGTPLAAGLAGLPSNGGCIADRRLRLRLSRLSHLRHRKIMHVDVYVNGHRVLSESGRLTDKTLTRLPRRGTYTVKVVATTRRGYHLITKLRYHAC
ncbi:MAG: hypothetical protein WCB67_09955 [Solirubrobacteraceae bacterium]